MPFQELRQQLPNIKTTAPGEPDGAGAIYEVVKEFNARLEDELSLKVGDKIEVISDDKEYNDGWYMGKSLSTSAAGLYPKAFTQLIPSLSKPTLLRSRSRRIGSPSSATHSPISFQSTSATPVLPRTEELPEELPHALKESTLFDSTDETEAFSDDADKSNFVNGALSEIDKALEELRTDASDANLPAVAPISTLTASNVQGSGRTEKTLSTYSDNGLNPEFVETWTPEQVTAYFSYLGFDIKSAGQFVRHKITGSILLELELAYLKELDINSFGTRFEMYKEIEALKEFAKENHENHGELEGATSNELLAPADVHRSKLVNKIDNDFDSFTRPLGHSRKKSQSLDDIPESARKEASYAPNSQLKQNRHSMKPLSSQPPSSQIPQVPSFTQQFASPRKAPNPPSYPSPIQVKEGSKTPNTYKNNRLSKTPVSGPNHSKKKSLEVSTDLKSPTSASHSRKPSYEVNMNYLRSHSRNGSSNLKSSSFADLLRMPNHSLDNGRPASSIYYDSQHSRASSVGQSKHLRRSSDVSSSFNPKPNEEKHQRRSSMLSFLSGNGTGNISPNRRQSPSKTKFPTYESSPSRLSFSRSRPQQNDVSTPTIPNEKQRSFSAKETKTPPISSEQTQSPKSGKRTVSETVRAKTLRNISSSSTLKPRNNKKETSAFVEGIRSITPPESIKTADCYGWMSKKGGYAVGNWKQRYFTLHGTRLSYFTSLSDTRERGLIDITSHKVLPAKEDDKLVSLYAASTGHGKFCFKVVPPAPGSRKGLTFTQQKIHYFAVDSKEEMRSWMAALIKATIDIDESVPILSSCATPTVSLQKAQTMLQQARENTKRREESGREREQPEGIETFTKPGTTGSSNDISGSSSISPDSDSFDSNIPAQSPNTTNTTSETPVILEANGFSSPYNIISPKINSTNSSNSTPVVTPTSATYAHSPGDLESKSKSHKSMGRSTSSRVASSASASAAAAALNNYNRQRNGSSDNKI